MKRAEDGKYRSALCRYGCRCALPFRCSRNATAFALSPNTGSLERVQVDRALSASSSSFHAFHPAGSSLLAVEGMLYGDVVESVVYRGRW